MRDFLNIRIYSDTSSLDQSWLTWEKTIGREGRRTFIIAIAPLETYKGTHHEVSEADKMVKGTSTGVCIIKELTENTCEWTWAQQIDFKFSLTANMLDFFAKQNLAWADELQEKFRRNGKEVDGERVAALAGKMIDWR